MIIMKFGGTSVGSAQAIKRLIDIVKSRLEQKPVVVVSAIATATDILYRTAELAARGDIINAQNDIAALQEKHHVIAKDLLSSQSLLEATLIKIDYYFTEINDLLRGLYLISELSKRTTAKVASYGELLSSTIINAALTQRGIANVLLDARDFMITNGEFLGGEPDLGLIKQKIPESMNQYIKQNHPVLTQGFISQNNMGITTNLGRGGSDYSASLIGMALNADLIEIWTDVDGIMSADPRKVAKAKLVPVISFEEAAELAYFGAKVLHPLTIQPAMSQNIPIKILNSLHPEHPGTLVVPNIEETPDKIKSIAYKENIKTINIYSTRMLRSTGFMKRVFEIFDQNHTSIDVITTSEVNISLTLDNEEHLSNIIKDLEFFAEVTLEENKSLVCVVGKNIRNTKGIMHKVFRALNDFKVSMISMGGSLTNLSLVVDKNDLGQVINNLHDEFFQMEQ